MLAEEEEHLVVFFYEESIYARRRLLKQLFLAQEKFNHINNSQFDTLMKKCSA